ncbi:MAG TPA: diguanylate cyclase [Anaerolineales bacterium]|nr:diguanylate cyclase [Anaerolineales bacterium]
MEDSPAHDIELYPLEAFIILLNHEVNRSRRYEQPLTLLHLAFETKPADPQTRYSAEIFIINILNLRLRDTDIPCKKDNEFLVLMPATDEQGGRMACERLEKLFHAEPQSYDRVSFEVSVFVGMATLPGDRSISSKKLLHNAAQALQHARMHRLKHTVIFSEIED